MSYSYDMASDTCEALAWGARHGVLIGFVKPPHERVVIGRFFCYRAYLRSLLRDRPGVTRVAMVDATDVLFQDSFMRRVPVDRVAYAAEPAHMLIGRAWPTLLATSQDPVKLKKRGCKMRWIKMRWMTWRVVSASTYSSARATCTAAGSRGAASTARRCSSG